MSPRSVHPEGRASALTGKNILGETMANVILSSELLEALPDAIVAVDAAGTIVQVNSQTSDLFGYERDELIGQKVELLVPDNYRQEHHRHRDNFAGQPRTRRMGANISLSGRRRNGSEFPVEISLSPVMTDSGMIVLSAIRDITDRQRLEEALRHAHEELYQKTVEQLGEYRSRLASIIDTSEDAIIGKDLAGTITSWNKGAKNIYGYAAEEIIGKHISLLAPADRPDEIPSILEKIARGESVDHHELVRVTKDGRLLNVSISVSPLFDARGQVVGASAIARDITAQKRAERQLQQSQKMEAIGRLAGGVAHDFNNILAIINACNEFLRTRVDPAAAPPEYIENIKQAIDRGSSLTRQLMAFSRNSAIAPRVLDLNERLQEVVRLLRPLMGDGVEILMAPKATPAIVEVDPGQFDQIVVNLALNARDAMPAGGRLALETSAIELDADSPQQHFTVPAGNYTVLAVSDTGSGMDEATMARIFEPFFTTKELGRGTGLGLATVYGIVQQSAGHIRVQSEPGHGTTFRIYFPSADHKIRSPLHQ